MGGGGKGVGAVKTMLINLAIHDRKKAKYILKKISDIQDGWTEKGEFAYNGKIVKRSHMIDLVKTFIASYKTFHFSPRRGSNEFLSILSELNIPESTVSNPPTPEQLRKVKNQGTTEELDLSEKRK